MKPESFLKTPEFQRNKKASKDSEKNKPENVVSEDDTEVENFLQVREIRSDDSIEEYSLASEF